MRKLNYLEKGKNYRLYKRITKYKLPQLDPFFALKNFSKKEAEKFIEEHTDTHASFKRIYKKDIKGDLLQEMKWHFGEHLTKEEIFECLEFQCYDNRKIDSSL